MICERCNADDGRPTKAYKVTKGDTIVSRELCASCVALTAAVYPVAGFVLAPPLEVEATGDAPEVEPGKVEEEEPTETRRARGRPRG